MAARIKAEITELKNIGQEIKRLNAALLPLRQRKKLLEASILTYMKQGNGLSTINLSNVQISQVEKTTRERMTKSEKDGTAIQLLQQSGVVNPAKTYNALKEMTKGKQNVTQAIKLVEK
jgi:hypothetical protein